MKPVAVTIVANNYIPLARTLSHSFLHHHPDGQFFVLIVDKLTSHLRSDQDNFHLVSIDEIDLPKGDLFFYQYSILEFSTAVKPFLLKHLLEKHKLENLIYLDPDILVTAPLTPVFESLSRASIVLTPHMLEPPPEDGKRPTESDIMLSGTYNLGFLAIRNDASVRRLMVWWGERLATKCIVDISNALFVDQRWMDLAPSYFDGVEILRDPALNVAYWNLHERKLSTKQDRLYVNGKPLIFYHFSGFNPNTPLVLSKHQSRHDVAANQALANLTKEYAKRLFDAGYAQLSKLENAFLRLPNGVRLGKLTQYVVRQALMRGLRIPSPRQDPDAFCRFLMTPNWLFDQRAIAPLLVALGHCRPDVRAAFPSAFESPDQADSIRSWIRNSGGKEEQLSELFEEYGDLLDRIGVAQLALKCWRARSDLQRAFPSAFCTIKGSEEYAAWIERYGTVEADFAVGDGSTFLKLRKGLLRVLMLYLQDPNLQKAFPFLFIDDVRIRFVRWLYSEACPRDIVSPDDVAWFDGFAENDRETIAAITFGHSLWLQANLVGGGTVYDLRNLKDLLSEHKHFRSDADLKRLYCTPYGRSLLTQAEQHYLFSPTLRHRFPNAFEDQATLTKLLDYLSEKIKTPRRPHATPLPAWKALIRKLRSKTSYGRPTLSSEAINGDTDFGPGETIDPVECLRTEAARYSIGSTGVNIAGYFHAPTGMGESARSMARICAGGKISFRVIPLPSTHIEPRLDIDSLHQGALMTSHDPANRINLVIANGDDFPYVRSRLPHAFWAERRNIGYWVWETEELPKAHSDCDTLSEIWTPSEYSANAIRKVVNIPVRVVPHALDFDEIDQATPDRSRFGIPENKTAFGFFFDCKSVVERKNPLAIVRAFRMAFGSNPHEAVLVFKASSPDQAPAEIKQLKMETDGLNVVWITDVLSRAETLALMKSLDVYVSLHRSEGFGLTLAEAMAMGKAVVATNYSGNMDFMDSDISCLVRAKVIETSRAFGAYPAGTRWGDPDIQHAADHFQTLLNPAIRDNLGSKARQTIRENLDPKTVGIRVSALLRRLSEDIHLANYDNTKRSSALAE